LKPRVKTAVPQEIISATVPKTANKPKLTVTVAA
jgi:hypothetical protein